MFDNTKIMALMQNRGWIILGFLVVVVSFSLGGLLTLLFGAELGTTVGLLLSAVGVISTYYFGSRNDNPMVFGHAVAEHVEGDLIGGNQQNSVVEGDYIETQQVRETDQVNNSGSPDKPSKAINQIRNKRIEDIQERRNHASELPDGPVVAMHLFASEVGQTGPTVDATELPDPIVLGKYDCSVQTRGKHKEAHKVNQRFTVPSNQNPYSIVENNGTYETVSQDMFWEDRRTGDLWLDGSVSSSVCGFDASITIAAKEMVAGLKKSGFTDPIFMSIALIGAESAILTNNPDANRHAPALGSELYLTNLYPITADDEIIAAIEPAISEVWREFGHNDGTPNIENGTWNGGRVRMGNREFLSTGDT